MSKYISFGGLGLLILLLMAGTIIEKMAGRDIAMESIYTSPLVLILWAIVGVASLIHLIRCRVHRQRFTFLLHLSFLLILAGALTTHLYGRQGSLHLRQGEPATDYFQLTDGMGETFPFRVSLKEFRLEYYTGTFAPMDYVSTLLIEEEGYPAIEAQVSMNNILTHHNYRFYQSGYDKDARGTLLSISYDPYGITVTYTGYLLLLISMLGFFFQRESGFRQLLRHPLLRRGALSLMLLLLPTLHRANEIPQTLPREVAAQFGDLYVYYNERICPLQTLAKDFTVKLYGKESYKGLTPEQVMTGWFFYYDDWKKEPMIRIKKAHVRNLLGIEREYACLTDFADVQGYKLEKAMQQAGDQAVYEANEKFNLVSMLCTGSLLKIYPYTTTGDSLLTWASLTDRLPTDMSNEQWVFIRSSMNYVAEKVAMRDHSETILLLEKIKKYQLKECGNKLPSDTRFKAEKLYNSANYIRPLAMGCTTVGILAFVLCCVCLVRRQQMNRFVQGGFTILSALLLVYLTFLIVLRGYVSGHIPLSNGFETMQFMAWCSVLLTLLMPRRFTMAPAFGFLLCGLTLMVSMFGESNPRITNLMPVLQSPLLSIHVVVIMIAYSLLAFALLNGVTAVVLHYSRKDRHREIEYLSLVSRLILYPAVFLLAAGIFIGAVWANVSWGRYWGWDPKEVWALITLLVYSLPLHRSSLPWLRRPMTFHLFCIVAFLTVLITYFGVNFFLGGMHSYA